MPRRPSRMHILHTDAAAANAFSITAQPPPHRLHRPQCRCRHSGRGGRETAVTCLSGASSRCRGQLMRTDNVVLRSSLFDRIIQLHGHGARRSRRSAREACGQSQRGCRHPVRCWALQTFEELTRRSDSCRPAMGGRMEAQSYKAASGPPATRILPQHAAARQPLPPCRSRVRIDAIGLPLLLWNVPAGL